MELGSSCGSNINDQQPLMTNNQAAISSEENENFTVVSAFTNNSSTIELSTLLEDDPILAPLLMGTPNKPQVIETTLHDYSKVIIYYMLRLLLMVIFLIDLTYI